MVLFGGYLPGLSWTQGPPPNPEKTWKDWSTALKKEPRPPGPKMSQGRSSWGSSRSHRASWSAGDAPSGWTHQASATPHALVSQYSQACLDNTLLTWLGACLFGRWLFKCFYSFRMTWLMVPEKAQMAPGFFQSSSPSSIHSITSFDVKRVCPNMGHLISSLMEWPYIGAIIGWYTPFSDTPWYHMLYHCYPDKILLTSHWYRYCARINYMIVSTFPILHSNIFWDFPAWSTFFFLASR